MNGLSGFVVRRAAVVSLAVGISWVLIMILALTPGMGTDDVIMQALANGDHSGAVSEHLVFINVIWGWLLRGTYALVPGVPWYSVGLCVVQALSIAAITYVIIRGRRELGVVSSMLLLGWIGYTLPDLSLNLTFTSTAMLAAGAGFALLAFALRSGAGLGVVACALGLVSAAGLLRQRAMLLVMIMMSVVVLRALIAAPRRVAVVVAALLIVVPGAITGFDRWYIDRSDGWAEFRAFNSLRSQLHGTARVRYRAEYEPVLREMGWSRTELSMFGRWMYPDPEVFTEEALRTFLASTPMRPPGDPVATNLRRLVQPYGVALAAVALLFMWRVGGTLRRRRIPDSLWLVATVLAFALPLLYLTLYIRLPPRVGLPAWHLLPVVLLLEPVFAGWSRRNASVEGAITSRRIAAVAAAALTLQMFGAGTVQAVALSERAEQRRELLSSGLAIFRDVDPEGVFLLRGGDLPIYGADPLSVSGPMAGEPRIFWLGWDTFSPAWDARREALGLGRVLEDLASDPHVYLVSDARGATLIWRFIRGHYGIQTRRVPVAELIDDGRNVRNRRGPVYVWRFEPRPSPPA